MSDLPFDPTLFSRAILGWYAQSGRDLPWRGSRDPYRIWVSEVMLQQTTVAAVIDYYERFLQRFDTLDTLAAAPLEAVIDQWAGLGYYSRARNLHATAVKIVADYGGDFPKDPTLLQQLPGIGRSTAGAIAALAFDRQAPILDANVRRVLCRIFALQLPPRSATAEKMLWEWAQQLTPEQQVHDYTQGMMDLGALVCLPKRPLCQECPVQFLCRTLALKLQQQIPVREQKKAIPRRCEAAIVVHRAGKYQLQRRPIDGFLGGLWAFPAVSVTEDSSGEGAVHQYLQQSGLRGELTALGSIRHSYSHFQLESQIFKVQLADCAQVAEAGKEWKTLDELANLGLHGAHKKIYYRLRKDVV